MDGTFTFDETNHLHALSIINQFNFGKKRVIFGIRPEDLPEADCALPGETIEAVVEVTEPLGSDVFLDVKIGERSLTARAEPTTQAKPHATICLQPSPENMRFFDIETEKALLT
jgi:multiple sugar transport system ATP-binding protein